MKRKAEERLVFCGTEALSQLGSVDSELPQTLKGESLKMREPV